MSDRHRLLLLAVRRARLLTRLQTRPKSLVTLVVVPNRNKVIVPSAVLAPLELSKVYRFNLALIKMGHSETLFLVPSPTRPTTRPSQCLRLHRSISLARRR
jgi:hypothetical protein